MWKGVDAGADPALEEGRLAREERSKVVKRSPNVVKMWSKGSHLTVGGGQEARANPRSNRGRMTIRITGSKPVK